MTNDAEAGTVDDLIADAKKRGVKVTQRMIMDWQTVGLLDYPAAQGGRGRGHGSNKKLYSGNQRRLFTSLLEKRAQTPQMLNLSVLPVYLWIYWGDEYVPMRQMRRAMRFYLDKALKPSLEGCRKNAAAIVAQLRHPQASQTHVNKLERLLAEAMYGGRELTETIKAEMRVVFDPFDEGRTLGPPGAILNVDAVVIHAVASQLAANTLSRGDQFVSDEMFVRAREMLRRSMSEYLQHQPDLALQAGSLTKEFAPVTVQSQVNTCRTDLLSNLGYCLMDAGRP